MRRRSVWRWRSLNTASEAPLLLLDGKLTVVAAEHQSFCRAAFQIDHAEVTGGREVSALGLGPNGINARLRSLLDAPLSTALPRVEEVMRWT